MKPRTHAADELLASYATGELALGPSITVSSHLQFCAECRAQVVRFEEAEGRLLEQTPAAALGPDALPRILARIDAESTPVAARRIDLKIGDVSAPDAVARVGVGRRRWVGVGLWAARVNTPHSGEWRTFILRAPAGSVIPGHTHLGAEYISVLMGEIEDGETYAAGDFAQSCSGSDHSLRVSADGPCACLISAQGRLRWEGIAKLIWPLLGI